jgi:L-threonylcarbamoyladenylate synthase
MDHQRIKEIGENIKRGEIAVIPTDTIYSISCSAFNEKSVKKIYKIKNRSLKKPFIILISSIKDLSLFNINPNLKILKKYWPGKISIIMDCKEEKFKYLHRGKKSLAFRLPDNIDLIKIIKISGPIVSSSVNTEGNKPAINIKEAKEYFKNKVNFYIDKGPLKSKPSKIISLVGEVIRK